eukprot:2150389-Alexandrium_andersonii.AAC.1
MGSAAGAASPTGADGPHDAPLEGRAGRRLAPEPSPPGLVFTDDDGDVANAFLGGRPGVSGL